MRLVSKFLSMVSFKRTVSISRICINGAMEHGPCSIFTGEIQFKHPSVKEGGGGSNFWFLCFFKKPLTQLAGELPNDLSQSKPDRG